ncbi:hypothetical protein WJX74_001617 [Apatococcus lobatus]|uniref:RecF/RecN/SMC N-terminal domain-containing protein n=1 Tax=Apatococcus lobatus TaxID=904363 RepID=A0AAW1QWL9_9CHLO
MAEHSEPSSLAEAQAFVGRSVTKYFPPAPELDFLGGQFEGKVIKVDTKLTTEEGVVEQGFFYKIRYADEDEEHVLFKDLQAILKASPIKKRIALSPGKPSRTQKKARRQTEEEDGMDQENQPSSANVPRAPKRGQTPGTGSEAGKKPKKSRQSLMSSYPLSTAPKPISRSTPRQQAEAADEETGQPARTPATAPASQPFESQLPTPLPAEEEDGERPVWQGLPGQIKKIHLENFMCHAHFEMEFGPHINFISGENGSGKSAVLQALQQALGVSARKTGRASKQANFIKEGCSQALIAVTLWNEGRDAFRPEAYGKFITIERRVHYSGSSNFTLKDWRGRKVQGAARDELDRLTGHLNLDASNPITVMTQDISRSFLGGSASSSDSKKFELYMDATMLSQTQENISIAKDGLLEMSRGAAEIRAQYEAAKEALAESNKTLEALRELDGMIEEQALMQNAFWWLQVQAAEAEAAQMDNTLQVDVPKLKVDCDQKLAEAQARLEEVTEVCNQSRLAMSKFNCEFEGINAEVTALRTALTHAKIKAGKGARNVTQMQETIDSRVQDREDLTKTAAEVNGEAFKEAQAAHKAWEEQVQARLEALEAAKAEEREKNSAHDVASHASREEGGKRGAALQEVTHIKTKLDGIKQQMQEAQQGAKNKTAAFGGNAVLALCAQIEAHAGRFHRKPIGPIGDCIELIDDRWSRAIESAMGTILDKFLVHDYHDQRLLNEMSRRCRVGKAFGITVVNFDHPAHSLPPAKLPPPGVQTIMSKLTSSHPQASTIFNSLIDQVHIEVTGLCQSDTELRSLVRTPNMHTAFSGSGQKCVARGATVTMFPSRVHQARLGQSAQQRIREIAEYQTGIKMELQAAQEKVAEIQAQMARLSIDYNAAKNIWLKSRHERVNLENEYREAQASPPPNSQMNEEGEAGMEQEISNLNEQLVADRQELDDLKGQHQRLQDAEQSAQQLWQAKKDEAMQMQQGNVRAVDGFEKHAEEQTQAEQEHQAASRKLQRLMQKTAELEQHCAAAHVTHEDGKNEALKICSEEEGFGAIAEARDRLSIAADAAVSSEVVAARMKKLRSKITAQEKAAGGMREDVEAENQRLEARAQRARMDSQKIGTAYNALQAGWIRRQDKLKILDKTVEKMACQKFRGLMWKKGHAGSLKIRRQERKLEIKVCIKGDNAAGVEKDLKSLSGGERSFTTVAFSLALGDWLHSPIRAMDEPDVFMDNVNRRMSMESLFENAWDHRDLQFIFLTPLSLEAVSAAQASLADKGTVLPASFVQSSAQSQPRPSLLARVRGEGKWPHSRDSCQRASSCSQKIQCHFRTLVPHRQLSWTADLEHCLVVYAKPAEAAD